MAKTKLQGIKACVFDAYGTLFDVHSPVAKVAGKLGDKAEAVSNMWRLKHLSYSWLRALMGEYVPFWQVTAESLDYALKAHGVDDKDLRDELLNLYLTLDAYDDARVALADLKQSGLQTSILSNGSPDMLEAAVNHAGLADHLDYLISVAEVKIYKPHPSVYQLALDRHGVEPQDICFVSANTWDAQAAANFGFQAARIDRFGLIDENIPGTPSLMLKSLEELPHAVQA